MIAKLGHRYGEWVIVTEPKCEESGSRRKVCAVCEDEVTDEIPAKGHTWSEDYTVDKAPTCTEVGVKSIRCSECEAVKEGTETVIPAVGRQSPSPFPLKEWTRLAGRKKYCLSSF